MHDGRERSDEAARPVDAAGPAAPTRAEVAIVGAGLAGLVAAATLARSGRRVVVFDGSRAPGGRAVTHERNGFCFNMGAHALYNDGVGPQVLRELGVSWSGGVPDAASGELAQGGVAHPFPGTPLRLLTTRLFGWRAKLRLGALLARVARLDAGALRDVPAETWIRDSVADPVARDFLRASLRLSTYVNAPEHLSAGAGIAQLQLALGGGVTYLDGGWQTLVDGLVRAAGGARLQMRDAVRGVEPFAGGFRVRTAQGALHCRYLVLATSSRDADALLGSYSPSLRRAAAAAEPARAACLDLGLDRLPDPARPFLLGLDEPCYASVHSSVARLAPPGAALVQAIRYHRPEEQPDAHAVREQLERFVDRLQPGWRARERERRFLPNVTVATDLPRAAAGGVAGRPATALDDCPGAFLAGDWVGPEGQLAHASLASGRAAARAIAALPGAA